MVNVEHHHTLLQRLESLPGDSQIISGQQQNTEMLRQSSRALSLLARHATHPPTCVEALGSTGWNNQHARSVQQMAGVRLLLASNSINCCLVCRWLGGDKVPEYWGKPSPYTEGTAFLGTPTNHDQVCWHTRLCTFFQPSRPHRSSKHTCMLLLTLCSRVPSLPCS